MARWWESPSRLPARAAVARLARAHAPGRPDTPRRSRALHPRRRCIERRRAAASTGRGAPDVAGGMSASWLGSSTNGVPDEPAPADPAGRDGGAPTRGPHGPRHAKAAAFGAEHDRRMALGASSPLTWTHAGRGPEGLAEGLAS